MWLDGDPKLLAYFFLYEVSGVMLIFLLISFGATKHVRRTPVLISMTVSWLIGAFPSAIFLYITNNVTGPPPSFPVCLASSALIMAQTPLNATCAITLVYNIWSVLQDRPSRVSTRVALLVALPYVVWIICIIMVAAIGLHDQESVSRKTFYCVVDKMALTVFIGAYSAICCISACVFEVLIAINIRRNRLLMAGSGMDPSLILRVIAFGVTLVWGLALAGFTMYDWYSVVPDLCFATFGIIFCITFASQRDIIRLWRRWALALVDSNSFRTEPSSDRFVLTPREAKTPILQ